MLIKGLKNEIKIGMYRRLIVLLDELENESKMKSLMVTENHANRLISIEEVRKRVEVYGGWGHWVRQLEEEIKKQENSNARYTKNFNKNLKEIYFLLLLFHLFF
jgi:hypothetical protein